MKRKYIIPALVLWSSCTLVSYPWRLAAAKHKYPDLYTPTLYRSEKAIYLQCTRDRRFYVVHGALTGPLGILLSWIDGDDLHGRKYDCSEGVTR